MRVAKAVVMVLAGWIVHAPVVAECAAGNENPWIAPTAPMTQFQTGAQGTLVHQPTRLQWQRCALGQIWDGQGCNGTATSMTWSEALQAAEQHVQDGWSDWRLPNRNELASIIESACFLPALDAAAFPAAPSGGYWSSSPQFDAPAHAWSVNFDDGMVVPVDVASALKVRLVRAGWDD